MNLYLISQTQNTDYDSYDSAVVAAETEEEARNTVPGNCGWAYCTNWWCSGPEYVNVQLIGTSISNESGVILASFNAG